MEFQEDRPIHNLEKAINDLFSDGESFQDVQNRVNECLTRIVMTQKARQNKARQEAERLANEEQERVDAERKKRTDELLRQQRDGV
ncbi:MAG: hypothetical protein WB249_07000 [Candidatus Sulfotelmatobacter sp.]